MRKGLNKHEVVSLAKTMEVKFTVAGPAIGGAKSGINFDPKDPNFFKERVITGLYIYNNLFRIRILTRNL